MGVFWINTPVLRSNGSSIGFPFECLATPDVEALTEKLVADVIVSGSQLRTVDDGRGGKLVQSRKPFAITARGIASVTAYDFEVWEPTS